MSKKKNFVIRYVSPSIARRGQHEFFLIYSEDGVELVLTGKESSHLSGAYLYFPTSNEWALQYPNLLDQRERIKTNIIGWANSSPLPLEFIGELLADERKIEIAAQQREYEYASISRPSAEQLAEISRLQDKFLKRFTRSSKTKGNFFFAVIPAIISILALVYVMKMLEPHILRFG